MSSNKYNSTLYINSLALRIVKDVLNAQELFLIDNVLNMLYKDIYNNNSYTITFGFIVSDHINWEDMRIYIRRDIDDLWNFAWKRYKYNFILDSWESISFENSNTTVEGHDDSYDVLKRSIDKVKLLYKLINDGLVVIKYN